MEQELKKRLILGQKGKAILFAGAGCSIDCLNYENKILPTANPLLALFNKKLGKSISRLDIAASMYLDKDDRGYLNLLNETFFVKSVPNDLVDILRYDWDRIYTTNYDNALELSAQLAGKKARALTPQDDHKAQPHDNLQIVHLHGFIQQFDLDNVKTSCILDYNSNVANSVYDGPWAERLRLDIDSADVVVFIGYSLYDPEIAKLIRSAHTKDKVFFINSTQLNPELNYMQEKYGSVKSIGREGFAQILKSASKQAGKKPRQSYVCFDKGSTSEPLNDVVRQSDLNELFMFGNYDKQKAQADISNNSQKYIVKRDLVEKVISRIDEGADFISVFSRLGQGKTIFAQNLAAVLRAKGGGVTVFTATRNQMEFSDELNEIIEEYERPILIIDDFFRYKKHWDILANRGGKKIVVIATARINVFAPREREITEKFLNHEPEVFELGDLSVDEGRALVPLITHAGLWGSDAALSDADKLNKIRNTTDNGYQNNFSDILIGLMKSSDIVARFKKELDVLKEISRTCYDGILLIIYLEFTNNDPDITLLQEGFGNDLKEFLDGGDTEAIMRVFLVPDSFGIRYHSSVFSTFALDNALDSVDVTKVIQATVLKIATAPDLSQDYKRLLIDLMRFNYIKKLAIKNNFDHIFDFYDILSAEPEIAKDDLFENAFGMCERERGNLLEAMKHFRTSIALARNRGKFYVPYHAQNQLTVCLFEYGIQEDLSATDALSDLLESIKYLTLQADDERISGTGQAFAWHRQLGEFVDKYTSLFDENQRTVSKAHLLKYLNFIRSKVLNWEKRPGASRTVNELIRLTKNLSINEY
ncbi:MAG: SIR2 family protein [Rhodobacteraceae bacterium]|nr:SIR2 family protein [Paracoccaceae bacterium]